MISRDQGSQGLKPVSIGEPDKVTSWPFKEPEKKTAWKDPPAAPKEPRIDLRDHEALSAEKRTALIKERMSPPGALRLPDLLEAARWRWGIPDGAFMCQAVFDRIHVFPIDLWNEPDRYPGSSLFRPEITKKRDEQNGHRGILISMGLTAADHCLSHGIELGHVVRSIRNAPHAQECERFDKFSIFYLVLRDGDLTGSETQREELVSGKARIVDTGGDGYCFDIQGHKKKDPLIKDSW